MRTYAMLGVAAATLRNAAASGGASPVVPAPAAASRVRWDAGAAGGQVRRVPYHFGGAPRAAPRELFDADASAWAAEAAAAELLAHRADADACGGVPAPAGGGEPPQVASAATLVEEA